MSIRISREDLEVVARDKPWLREGLVFTQELSEAQGLLEEYVLERLRGLEPVLRSAAREAFSRGVPLVSLTGIPGIRDYEIRGFAASILEVGARHRPDLRSDLERVAGAMRSGGLKALELAGKLLAGEQGFIRSEAERLGVDPEVLEVSVFWVSQPVFSALRMIVEEELEGSEWGKGMCPVCGAYTRISVRREDGSLWLRCSICGAEWRYVEDKCPFCGNDDRGSIDVYTPMRDERFKLYICRRCGRYWKLVDESRLRSRVSRWLYDAWTRNLDEIALRLGLK